MKTEKSEHFKTKFHPQNQTNTPPAARFGRSKASDQSTRDIEHVVDKHRPYVCLFRLGCFLWFLCLVAFAFAFVFFLLFCVSASSPFCFLALFLRFSASLLLPFSALLCSLFFPCFLFASLLFDLLFVVFWQLQWKGLMQLLKPVNESDLSMVNKPIPRQNTLLNEP